MAGESIFEEHGRPIESEDLDKPTFARVVARRARRVGYRKNLEAVFTAREPDLETAQAESEVTETVAEAVPADEDHRKAQEHEIEKFFEKVHEQADFLPAGFLQDGADMVPAVCRIAVTTPRGQRYTGSGFLVANGGYIMTNNHVLEDEDWARGSLAIFHFQEGSQPVRVGLAPERFFLTNAALDFTIVACDPGPVRDVRPVPLFQNPALITRNERVYIIQHPRGRPKEVVLRDNDVTRVRDRVVWYRADTDGGSSGSPVFNEDWQLVALHHAGWLDPADPSQATNEGISLAAIIRFLQGGGGAESAGARGMEAILENVVDSSPFLGFFDQESSFEVSVDSFTGSSDYADVGFWNIEHFNDRVNEARVETVAEVVSTLALDVFGLTEVERGALQRLTAELGRFGDSYGFVYQETPGRQDIAILYDRDTTRVERFEEIYQRHQDKLQARTPGGKTAFPRWPLFAKCTVQEDAGDTPLTFVMVVVHLKAFVSDQPSRERRALAAEMLAQIVADIRATSELPVLIGGDYNELMTNDILDPLSEGPDTFALTTDDAEDGGISYVGRRHRSLIDHIVVSHDVPLGRIQGDDAAIVRLDRSVADFADTASDHVPLVMRMVYTEEPAQPVGSTREPAIEIPQGARRVKLDFS